MNANAPRASTKRKLDLSVSCFKCKWTKIDRKRFSAPLSLQVQVSVIENVVPKQVNHHWNSFCSMSLLIWLAITHVYDQSLLSPTWNVSSLLFALLCRSIHNLTSVDINCKFHPREHEKSPFIVSLSTTHNEVWELHGWSCTSMCETKLKRVNSKTIHIH